MTFRNWVEDIGNNFFHRPFIVPILRVRKLCCFTDDDDDDDVMDIGIIRDRAHRIVFQPQANVCFWTLNSGVLEK